MGSEQLMKGRLAGCRDEVIIDRRDQCTEGGGKPEKDGIAEGHAEIAHPEPVHQAADAPEDAPEIGPPESSGAGLGDDLGEVRNGEPCGEGWDDQPGEESAEDPIAFPGPVSDLFIGYVETA